MLTFLGTPMIETKRLYLRKFTAADTQTVFDHWLSDSRVSDNRVSASHQSVSETRERVKKIIEGYQKKSFCYWAIVLKEGHTLVGEIDLYDFDRSTENCSVSYSIGFMWWNQGYGTEALKAIIDFGFRQMGIHKIEAAHNLDNPASGRMMSKVGMKQEGVIKHMIRNSKNQYKDCAVWGLLQDEYLRLAVKGESAIKRTPKDQTDIIN
ncbi:GNAT family N-acetyltransferase [Shouchella patagoniensis]|uniref:GNAT family N-acetyltransferase n=1 Tax=Shouchella patagoniensis TaxID=228576 RepID=UPI000995829B|nr:GNAT family N-acetyltransferase [Shouchella patagoniensis]